MPTTGEHLRIEHFGTRHMGVRLHGDPKRPEPDEFTVRFPGGEVNVSRTSDGDYWAHIALNNPNRAMFRPEDEMGWADQARLDIEGKHSNEVDLGDFSDPGLYHLAVKVVTD